VPENILKQTIELRLLEDMHSARAKFAAGECDVDEYANALKRLNDFLIEGECPDERQPAQK
jgi:hypothetical protein